MSADRSNRKSNLSTKNPQTHSTFIIRNEQDARKAFTGILGDEQSAKSAAATFIKLGKELAGNNSNTQSRERIYGRFYEQIIRDSRTNKERTQDEKVVALSETISSMREENLAIHSSPEARVAHLEMDSYNNTTNNLRQLFEVPENRTQAEHAKYLNNINQEARDLYERGATVYGNTLIIPREANSLQDSKDKVRIGSLSHAVKEFTPLVGEEKAKEKAQEFVELGKNIAGKTADGDTLIVVFREFYNQIKKDDSGSTLSLSEKAERLDVVLERMRVLSDAMLKEEWQQERVEILSLDEWERGLESRQRDFENETNGRLNYRLEETLEHEFDSGRDEIERARITDRYEELTRANSTSNISYERIRLDDRLPQYPQNLSQEENERLRYEIIPQIDRAIENGVRPSEIINSLAAKIKVETRKEHDARIAGIFSGRVPEIYQEGIVTRNEEARGLYTLQVLGVIGNEVIREKGFSLRERADAIDVVGTRMAQDYREVSGRLKTFSELENERKQLYLAAKDYSDIQRATPKFQTLLKTLREEERVSFLSERNALIEGNNGRFKEPPNSSYSELIGNERTLSPFTRQRQANEQIENNLREQVLGLLVNPEIEKAQNSNAQRLTNMSNYFSRITNQEITNSDEARTALAPELKQMRLALNNLSQERSAIKIERTLGNESLPKPIYVGLSASKNGLRVAVDNLNEYKSVERVASNLSIGLQTYKGRFGEPIAGYSASREQELDFAREYVNYRLLDETTRLKNSNRLFREFSARLNKARAQEELRETIKTIRQENYAREKYPQRFEGENETINRNRSRSNVGSSGNSGEQNRRPLNEIELKKLFLSLAPSHYTQEMRELRLNNSLTKREKSERVKALENGTLEPSPALNTLLSEFDRTKSNNPAQMTRNIKAYLADYINPPSGERNRFSGYNLFELRQKLTPEESNYLFKVIDEKRQSITFGTLSKQQEQDRKERVQVSSSSVNAVQLKNLRDEIEGRVSNYLISVVQTRGIGALEQRGEGLHHAAMVSNIIKEAFKENNLRIETLGLTEERISNVSSKLVGEIPQALRERSKQIGDTLERQQLPVTFEKNSRLVTDSSNREETVRNLAQSAIEPIVNQRVTNEEKERTNEVRFNLSQNQVLLPTPTTMMNQPRPQDIAATAKTQTQKENPYVLSR